MKVDNLDIVTAYSWPKAIHEGNGNFQLFNTEKAREDQIKAIINIFSSHAKEEGPFALFEYSLDPQFVDITVNVDGKKSSFSMPDVMDVQVESFKNPVTGEEQQRLK